MKHILISIILLTGSAGAFAQEPGDSLTVAGNTAEGASAVEPAANPITAEDADKLAQDGKYSDAIDAYESLLAKGKESAGLYYNLGYSYFKSGSLGRAIINFERAKRLSPADADIDANLEQAYALTDKMEEVEPPVVDRMCAGVANLFGSDGWAWMFVTLFTLTLIGFGMFLFLDSVLLRKVGFFSSAIFIILAIMSLCISLSKKSDLTDSSAAIIMASSADLNTSPDRNATRMTVLHEGTYVKIVDTLGDWVEVKLKDGNIGWLKSSDIEKI